MAIHDFNRALKQRVKIITVDPPTRRIEAALKDGSMIQIALWEIPSYFRWPKEDEWWTVYQEGSYWILGSKMEHPNEEETQVEDLDPGEAKLNANTIFTAGGRKLAVSTWNPYLVMRFGYGDSLSGTLLFSPTAAQALNSPGAHQSPFFIDPSDFATSGGTVQVRIRYWLRTNSVTPNATFTWGLVPVSSWTNASGTVPLPFTLGIAATTIARTNISASTTHTGVGEAVPFPTAGMYVLTWTISTTTAANSNGFTGIELQYRQT